MGKLGKQDNRYEQGEENVLPAAGRQETAAEYLESVVEEKRKEIARGAEGEVLPADGWQQTAVTLMAAVAAQKFSHDRGASQALESLRELRRLASVWLQVNWDMDPYVKESVDQARIRLSQASQWLEDCDWMLSRSKEGRKRLREAKCTAIDVAEPVSELREGSGGARQKKADKPPGGERETGGEPDPRTAEPPEAPDGCSHLGEQGGE